MDTSSEISTPKNKCRRLGLNRSIGRNTAPKTPLSDVKVNYKSLLKVVESPSTPCPAQRISLKPSANTTNCLRYRLSLSSRARDKYKKKKLEFSTATSQEPEDESLRENSSPTYGTEAKPATDLLQEIISKEKLLESHEKHKKKVQELKSIINVWKEAFKASLEDLSAKIEPKVAPEDLLNQLGINPEMIEYT